MGRKGPNSSWGAVGTSETGSAMGPSPTKTQAHRHAGGDDIDFEHGQSPVRVSGPLGRISEAKSGYEASGARQGFQRDLQDGADVHREHLNAAT